MDETKAGGDAIHAQFGDSTTLAAVGKEVNQTTSEVNVAMSSDTMLHLILSQLNRMEARLDLLVATTDTRLRTVEAANGVLHQSVQGLQSAIDQCLRQYETLDFQLRTLKMAQEEIELRLAELLAKPPAQSALRASLLGAGAALLAGFAFWGGRLRRMDD